MPSSIPAGTLEKFTTFGDLLRFLRRRLGITQMELATAVGYSDAQISRLEQNLRLPDIPTIEARFVPALDLEEEPKAVVRLLALAANVHREDAPGLGLCPYKGLSYFDEADADLFVGREMLTNRLMERLLLMASEVSAVETRFLAVVGASGSGKSSLVRAGLVPALRWNKASADWNIRVLTPTAHPLERLAMSLTEENGSIAGAARLVDDLASDPRSLHLFAARRQWTSHEPRLLIVVDQFEELFSLCHAEAERVAFIDNLLTAASTPDGSTLVVITLRADFYTHCANYKCLRQALAQQQEYIGAMSSEELRRAIEEPARRGRWEIEPGLVELLLHDVGHEPGSLPLLSHALLETWHRRRGRTMTLSGYTSSGGVRGAIAETAEAVFIDQFTPKQRAIARRIFLRLTELGDETAAGDTRRRAGFDELILKPEETSLTQDVLKALADARLIITNQDSAEVAHEALIREWPTLRSWLEDNREGLRLHRHLTDASRDWSARNREPDILYRGARLAQALEWASTHPDEINTFEREFLMAAQELADHEAIEREAQRQRELEVAQKLAEAERRRAEEQARAAGQLRVRSLYLVGAFIIAVIMLVTAGFLGWQARLASRLATSRELAAASLGNLDIDPERSLLLALQAISTTYTLEAEDALHQALMASRIRRTLLVNAPGAALSVDISPDGSRLATASADETVVIWDFATGERMLSLPGRSASFSPDGRHLATVTSDGTIKIWDAASGVEIPLDGHINADFGVEFSPDGSRLATIPSGNLPRVWGLETGKELVNFAGHTDYVSSAIFSPDGKRLLTASDDGSARVWDAATGQQLLSLREHPGWVWAVAFSPDGSRIATSSENTAVLWDSNTGERLVTLNGHKNTIYALAFSPDGRRLATGGDDRKVIVWSSDEGEALLTLAGHTGAVYGLAFSPDGSSLASSSADGTVRIWDVTPAHEALTLSGATGARDQIAFSANGENLVGVGAGLLKVWNATSGQESYAISGKSFSSLAISPDGRWIAAVSNGTQVVLMKASSGEELSAWSAHSGRINALAFDAAGTRLATASDDYKVKIWDVSVMPVASQPIETFDHPDSVWVLAFSPDGKKLGAGVNNGTVVIWDLATHKAIHTLRGHRDAVVSVAFSPDGKRLASASLDSTAREWDLEQGRELVSLVSHNAAVMAVSFSPNGRRIATASRDGVAKLWDADIGQETLTFYGDGASLNSLSFSPDGKRFAASGDTGAHIYLLDIGELVRLAQGRVTRSLSTEECQKYLHRISGACVAPATLPTPTPFPRADTGRICQVTNQGGLFDNYFNELIYKGVKASAIDLGWQANTLQSASRSDFSKNIEAFIGADCNLIVSPGTLVEEIQFAAGAKPAQKFMMLDFPFDPPLENVWMQVYATDQAAFLAGYVAASATKSGKVGVFGGVDIPQVTGFMDGFALGVAYYNEQHRANVEVIGWDPQKHVGLFTGGFCCTTEGRQMAQRLLEAGADVILPVAGESVGWGAGAEVMERGGAYLIGVDTDWTATSPEFADILLTSIEKRYDLSVVQAAGAIMAGSFSGGIHTGTLATGEVGISPFHKLESLISPTVKTELEGIAAEIISGKIKTSP